MKVREIISGKVIVTNDLYFYLKIIDEGQIYVRPMEPREENDQLILYSLSVCKEERWMLRHYVIAKRGNKRVLLQQFESDSHCIGYLIDEVALFCNIEPLYNRPGDYGYFLANSFAFVENKRFDNCFPQGIDFVEDDDFILLSGGYIRLKKEGCLQYLKWQKEVGFVEIACSEKQIPLGCLPLSEIGLTEADLKNLK